MDTGMGIVRSIMHIASNLAFGIPEWSPHEHDRFGRNVPLGMGVESRRYRHAFRPRFAGRAWGAMPYGMPGVYGMPMPYGMPITMPAPLVGAAMIGRPPMWSVRRPWC